MWCENTAAVIKTHKTASGEDDEFSKQLDEILVQVRTPNKYEICKHFYVLSVSIVTANLHKQIIPSIGRPNEWRPPVGKFNDVMVRNHIIMCS